MIAVVILAAGGSKRLGRPKQLEVLGGETLLGRAVRVAQEAELGTVVVVLGAQAAKVDRECDLGRAWVVVNSRWAEGMGSSVRVGVELVNGFAEAEGVLLMTCDMPRVTAEHLRELATGRDEVVASRYAGRNGVPAYFPRRLFPELMLLSGDAGARELLREARAVELEGGECDVDTAEGLERARSLEDGQSSDSRKI